MKLTRFKGATMWEAQLGRFWVSYVHLKGGQWDESPIWYFWDRFNWGWDTSNDE